MCCCEYELMKYILIYLMTLITVIYLVSGQDHLSINEDISRLTDATMQTTTIDPALLESYRKKTIISFTVFGVIFGLMNVVCWIASIIKAVVDRRRIKRRNLARHEAKRFKSESHRRSVLKDLLEPEPPKLILPNVVDNVIRNYKTDSSTTPTSSESPIHHFSRYSTLQRSSSPKQYTQDEMNEPTEKDYFMK
ncbi:hypothetical protein EWB00_006851 [Schistosoma japonicum]|uniref:SJCHGC05330 protein n=1 Tax=Schistosoma japonicum TaxID=6182 RepID=Q5DDN6_SCHJA|nr:SJCHGC05330 protein [Schistosoma japonicum]KAH8852041.1 hypothetical protein KSF78_0001027 [Schistosoma japonicum]TNN08692.1 hypothetical protein EWB00_006851 [Schistosoma japonicum]CAX74281.1 hypothetical protein [Schistosoma japonicum]CAX74282.1 hypothetical protein [Schistosoma japonicum]